MKVRLLVRGVALLGALTASLAWGLPATQVAADPLPQGVVDFSVDATSVPEIVAPPGSGVVYRIAVSNSAVGVAGNASATGTLPAGFTFLSSSKDSLGNPECTASGSSVTCTFVNVLPGTTQSADVRATTSTTIGTYTFPVHVTSTTVVEPLSYQSNNDDTATTQVVTDPAGSYAYVCGGCSLSYSNAAIGSAKIIVPASSNGVFVKMNVDTTFTGSACGPTTDPTAYHCNDALGISFLESGQEPDYQANNPDDPIRLEYSPKQTACYGVSGGCAPIGYFDPSKGMTRPLPMANCDGAGTGDNPGSGKAYVNGVYQICRDSSFKVGNKVTHRVLMKSTDPLIPPFSL
jgi:uncharacterized repeat protein (TIGR01451 family)